MALAGETAAETAVRVSRLLARAVAAKEVSGKKISTPQPAAGSCIQARGRPHHGSAESSHADQAAGVGGGAALTSIDEEESSSSLAMGSASRLDRIEGLRRPSQRTAAVEDDGADDADGDDGGDM